MDMCKLIKYFVAKNFDFAFGQHSGVIDIKWKVFKCFSTETKLTYAGIDSASY